jgi:hypothetical protein
MITTDFSPFTIYHLHTSTFLNPEDLHEGTVLIFELSILGQFVLVLVSLREVMLGNYFDNIIVKMVLSITEERVFFGFFFPCLSVVQMNLPTLY